MTQGSRRAVRIMRRRGYLLAVAGDDEATLRSLLPLLNADERAMRQARSRSHLIGRALLRALQAHALGRRRQPIRFAQNRRPLDLGVGRPRLALSVSHSAGCVVAAGAFGARAGQRIGIDLEARQRQLSDRLSQRIGGGIARWVRIEATLKCDGRGVPALGALLASPDVDGELHALRIADRAARRITVQAQPLQRRRRYRLAVARSAS